MTLNIKAAPGGETEYAIVAATRIQANYKGYRVKEDYQKQKDAGERKRLVYMFVFTSV